MRFWSFSACLLLTISPATAQIQDTQLWATVGATVPISGPLSGGLEYSLRTGDNNAQLSTTFVRPSLSYKVSKSVNAKIGYVWIVVHPDGGATSRERRLFEEVTWNLGHAVGGTWGLRTQIEQRFVEGRRDVGWRLRERLRLSAPLRARGPSLVFTSEFVFALNTTDYGARAGFDQTRNFVGISVPIGQHATAEAGYMNRYSLRSGAADRDDHIFPVTLSYRL